MQPRNMNAYNRAFGNGEDHHFAIRVRAPADGELEIFGCQFWDGRYLFRAVISESTEGASVNTYDGIHSQAFKDDAREVKRR